MKELISVIVPIYNVEKYLDRCVQSIIDQTYKNLEIILVDDGSPDNCPKMCDEYAKLDKRIKVIHKKNGGLMAAWIDGVKMSSGKYIAFVDSDDWVEKTYIEDLYMPFNKYKNLQLTICKFYRATDDEKHEKNTPAYHFALRGDRLHGFVFLVCRSLFNRVLRVDLRSDWGISLPVEPDSQP